MKPHYHEPWPTRQPTRWERLKQGLIQLAIIILCAIGFMAMLWVVVYKG